MKVFDIQTGVWSPPPDILVETVVVGVEAPRTLTLTTSAIAFVRHVDGSESVGGFAGPSMISLEAGDIVTLLPGGEFTIPVRVAGLEDTNRARVSVTFHAKLVVSDPNLFVSTLIQDDVEVSSVELGTRVGREGAIRLGAQKAMRDPTSDLETSLANECSEPLSMLFGLTLQSNPFDCEVSATLDAIGNLRQGMIVAGHWRIVRRLGQGAFGEVWLVEHSETPGLQRALKVVRNDTVAQAVRRETKRLLQIEQHPVDFRHVARLMDVLPDDPPCLLYEYVAGQNLTEYVAEHGGHLEPDAAIAIIRQVIDGLEQIHKAGLIHRDLHPGNVMVQTDGREPVVKILDLGLAFPQQPISPSASLSRSVLDTQPSHPFAEPVWRRDEQLPDIKTDYYSAGVLLWWMLTGQAGLPAGKRLEEAWGRQPIPALELIRIACLVDRDQTPTSATELLKTLDRTPPTASARVTATRAPTPPTVTSGRSARAPYVVGGTAVLVALVILLGSLILNNRSGSGHIVTPTSVSLAALGNTPATTTALAATVPTSTPTPPPTPTPTPSPSPTPTRTPTPVPSALALLYQVNWSNGMAGWTTADGWKESQGMLVNDGTACCGVSTSPPYSPGAAGISNYAVQAKIRLTNQADAWFGIGVRQEGDNVHTGGYVVNFDPGTQVWGIYPVPQTVALVRGHFQTDNSWHTYRVEVQGQTIRFFLDGVLMGTAHNGLFPSGGSVAIFCDRNDQIEIADFKIYRLLP